MASPLHIDPLPPLLAVSTASRLAARAAKERERLAGALKGDRSPVTVADLAVQVVVLAVLRACGAPYSDRIVGEESAESLDGPDGSAMLREAWELMTFALGAAGFASAIPQSEHEIRELLDAGGLDPQTEQRDAFWCLDPIDGTKGFLRGGQFAIALGLVQNEEPKLGILGCPHLPLGIAEDYGKTDPVGSTYLGTIDGDGPRAFAGPSSATTLKELQPIHVAQEVPQSEVRVCLSYEKAHSDKDRTSSALTHDGVNVVPIRIDSQCKYAMVASGRADLYLRLTRGDYREKSWDHAAGTAVVRAAGGIAEDMTGKSLLFPGRILDTTGGICVRTPVIQRPQIS